MIINICVQMPLDLIWNLDIQIPSRQYILTPFELLLC